MCVCLGAHQQHDSEVGAVQTLTFPFITNFFWQNLGGIPAHRELPQKLDSRDMFKPICSPYIYMKKLIFPETRRFMSPHQGFALLHWITRNWLSGYGWTKAVGDGWGQGCFTTATQETREPNQPLAWEAVRGPVCSCSQIRWPFSWKLQVSRCQACPSLFCFATFHSNNYCPVPAVFLPASPLCSILGFFVLLHDDITYLSWNFGVVRLAHLHKSKVWLQRPVLLGLPRGPLLDSGDACHSCGQGSAYSGRVHWFEPDKRPALLIQMEQTAACSHCGFNTGMSEHSPCTWNPSAFSFLLLLPHGVGRKDWHRTGWTVCGYYCQLWVGQSDMCMSHHFCPLISLNCPWLRLGCLMLAGLSACFQISELWLLLGKGLPMGCPPAPALIPTFYLIHSTRHNLSLRIGWTLS